LVWLVLDSGRFESGLHPYWREKANKRKQYRTGRKLGQLLFDFLSYIVYNSDRKLVIKCQEADQWQQIQRISGSAYGLMLKLTGGLTLIASGVE
jgi:hypothetical protein